LNSPLPLMQLFVNLGRKHIEAFDVDTTTRSRDLKQRIHEVTGQSVDTQRLNFGALEFRNEMTVAECGLGDGHFLTLILRFDGGSTAATTTTTAMVLDDVKVKGKSEKLKLKDGEKECVVCKHGTTYSAPCGDPYHVECILDWVENGQKGKTKIGCFTCKKEWPFAKWTAAAKLTNQQVNDWQKRLMARVAFHTNDIRMCPLCRTYSETGGAEPTLKTQCTVCAKFFCHECQHEWSGSSATFCGNSECPSKTGSTAKEVILKSEEQKNKNCHNWASVWRSQYSCMSKVWYSHQLHFGLQTHALYRM